jgi:hypothetical protein
MFSKYCSLLLLCTPYSFNVYVFNLFYFCYNVPRYGSVLIEVILLEQLCRNIDNLS